MKLVLATVLSILTLPAWAFAGTASPAQSPPSVPIGKDAKTDFTKPFVDDRLVQQAPPQVQHAPPPHVEFKAGPEAR